MRQIQKIGNKGAKLESVDQQLVKSYLHLQEFFEKLIIKYEALAECIKIIKINFL